ncbi:DUF1080 domain-containing protein [Aliifodinibius sp. S!AR15-10]|uniref:family 16 glycoside hydrolase n=1 Tax=Aliifodinibius sp. S!AR15-10 TaxID=2950437 RepID=UPI0028613FE3|nr:family 16 glycoside hydrolase [Aliifodinibius sp. S!AR15-10]MDR8392765.1 DUF1080 domain-containing protein [Aliifodinibius sp. S!AR15-10]
MNVKAIFFDPSRWIACLVLMLFASGVNAQDSNQILLDGLNSFNEPAENWQMAGEVTASMDKDNTITVTDGSDILVNNPQAEHGGEDLYTKLNHGDIDLELDYMMPRGSNSGIYLQGRYELQLHDSWTVKVPSSSNNGGIYERPAGVKGRQGYAPRQNASRAPGLWQHLELSFRAPRFNENGEKVENARILRAELNGVVIHEDVELLGPTAGAYGEGEVPEGPLRFQGDHGPVAFRNIRITRYDRTAPTVKDLQYSVYEGEFTEEPDIDTLSVIKSGSSELLTPYLGGLPEQFLLRYTGTIQSDEAGNYTFELNVAAGAGLLRISGNEVIPIDSAEGSVNLSAGEVPFELLYARRADWAEAGFQLSVSAEGLRSHSLSDMPLPGQSDWNPIYVHAEDKPLLRSFMDLPGGSRVTHGISVSSLNKLHYTYDMNHGSLVQVWRGDFLDVTPMWYSRGDGSSRPNGSVEHLLESPALSLNKLENDGASWKDDTTGTGYESKGYTLDDNDNPQFRYEVFGTSVRDKIRVVHNGGGVRRSVTLKDISDDLYFRLASGKSIRKVENNRYLVDDQSYYIQLENPKEPIIRETDGRYELIIPAQPSINYTILF